MDVDYLAKRFNYKCTTNDEFKQDLIEVSPGFSAHKYDMISLKSIANSI